MLLIIGDKEDSLGEKFKKLQTLIKTNSSHITPISKFDMDNLIQKAIQNDLPEFQKEVKEARFNIMVLGKSGVGKSTLINAVLKKNVAKTGAGYQMTTNLSYYENSFLRLYDSRGIQISGYTLKESSQEILDTIENLSKEDLDKYIHAIWYCFKGKRFESEEVEYCRNLLNDYSDKKLPIFIVETNSINEDDSIEMEKIIRNDLGNEKIFYVPVMALETKTRRGGVIPAFGVDELVEESLKKAEEAVDSSFYNQIQLCITILFIQRTIFTGIQESEDLVTKETLEVIKNEKNLKEIFSNYKNVFKSIIEKYYVNGKEPFDSKLQNQKELDDIFEIINIWNEENFQDSLNSFNSQLENIFELTKQYFKTAMVSNFKTEKELNYFMKFAEKEILKPLRKSDTSTFYSIFFYLSAQNFCEGITINAIKTFKNSSDPIISAYINHSVKEYIRNIRAKYEKSK